MQVIADQLKLNNDILAKLLINTIGAGDYEANIYYNFPFYRGETTDDIVQAHVMFVSPKYGVLFFRCLENVRDYNATESVRLDSLDAHIFSKISKQEQLRKGRRDLKIKVTPFVFVQTLQEVSEQFVGLSNVHQVIKNNEQETLDEHEFALLVATIEGTVNLRHKKDRKIDIERDSSSKGAVLSIIQNHEAVFDIEQKRAALNIIDSPQRIRGLAGSGKTIILTMKAALYHLQNPEALICYTYFTKALYGQIKYLIEKYYRDFSENREPNWKNIQIMHGWGGKGLKGVYSDTCFENGIIPISFPEAKSRSRKDPFSYLCEELDKNNLKQKFDLTLIDEGQDFPKFFYRVCRKITKNERLVWAYDDFQNIFDVEIQDEKETFGKDANGEYYVDFSKRDNSLQDIILHRCYRNPRIALISAFSLGLGIYNDRVLQRLENNKHWEDLGFEVRNGNSADKEAMEISRPEKNSPSETNKYFKDNSIIVAEQFSSLEDECSYVADKIEQDIRKQNLRPDDICVIGLDQANIASYFDKIQMKLVRKGIKVFNLLQAAYNNTAYSIADHITLSTINKAKGNESGMVYVVGIDQIFVKKNSIIERNKLFTAITRSKGWVVMTGMGSSMAECKKELKRLIDNNYVLKFIQPSKDDTKTILRGMNEQQSFLNDVTKQIEEFSRKAGVSQEEILRIIANQTKQKK